MVRPVLLVLVATSNGEDSVSLLQAMQKSEGLQKRSTVLAEEVDASLDTAIAGKKKSSKVAKVLDAYAQTGAHCRIAAVPTNVIDGSAPSEDDANTIKMYRTSLRNCEKKCDADSNCVAFEYNYKAKKKCILTKAVNLKFSSSYDEAKKEASEPCCTEEPCTIRSCCYSKPALPPAGYAMSGHRCKVENETEIDGFASRELSNKTLAQCASECDDDDSMPCMAFEWERATGECELKSHVNVKASVADGKADGGDGRCNGESCCYSKPEAAPDGWSQTGARCKIEKPKKKEKTCPNDLGVQTDGKNLADCKTACEANTRCVAFEFERENGECELASAVDLKASVADGVADGNDGRCNGDSCCYSSMTRVLAVQKWVAPAKYTPVATRCKAKEGEKNYLRNYRKVDDLADCVKKCDDNEKCKAFEFEPVSFECELKTSVDVNASRDDGEADGGDGQCNADSCCWKKD